MAIGQTLVVSIAFARRGLDINLGKLTNHPAPLWHQVSELRMVSIGVSWKAGLDPQQAISRPRFVLDRAPLEGARLMLEAGLDDLSGALLGNLGHDVIRLGPSEELMGHAQVIQKIGDVLVGGADPRSDGQVAAF